MLMVSPIQQLTRYQKAIEIYEDIARQSLNNNLLKYGVKGHLLNAGICQLCIGKGDVVAINNALDKYQELDPTFSGTREFRLLTDLADAIDQEDIGKFTDSVKEFDSMTQLGGILLGPSALGQIRTFGSELFPNRGTMVIETFASFGLMFFFFEMGVKMDTKMMLKPGKISLIIGISVFFSTLALTTSLSLILRKYISMPKDLYSSLPYIAASQALTSFPNIACLVTELKLLNSELGRVAMKTSTFTDMLGLLLIAICFSIFGGKVLKTKIFAFLSIIVFTIIVFYVFRPTIIWVQKHKSDKTITGEFFASVIFTIVLVAGVGSDIIGQHFSIGSKMIGLAVPDGPPLGAALVKKLDFIVSRVLYPTFLTLSGLETNIFLVHFKSVAIVLLIFVLGALVKIGAVLLAGRFTNLPSQDAIVLGLLLNSRGVSELVTYKFLKDSEVLIVHDFTMTVISVLAVMVIITPLIRILYDQPTNQTPVRRKTIQQAKHGTELRILVSIFNQDNVPAIMDLLEASNATQTSPISITALILVELVGRTTPMLIAHNPNPTLDTKNCHIINALYGYEVRNEGHVSIQSFSCISHFNMMHEDICRMALDQNATIIIVPFHKTWAIDGSIGSVQRTIQNINMKILSEAPCSVGILIDRGILRGSVSTFNNQSRYRVLILYIGGSDDVECLSYGARMAGHQNVTITIIRFLLLGYDTTPQFKKETVLINQIRDANEDYGDFYYREQVVRDGVGLSTCIRGLEDSFELIIAGKHHQEAALLKGLETWSECPELGPVGDMLASPDFGKKASILVVQQQRIGGKLVNRGLKPVVVDDRDIYTESTQSNGTGYSSSIGGTQPS